MFKIKTVKAKNEARIKASLQFRGFNVTRKAKYVYNNVRYVDLKISVENNEMVTN